MLTNEPVVRLVARETGAVDTALLTCADADGHAVLDVADRVGLGVLEPDEGKDHVVLCALRQVHVLGHDVGEQALVDFVVVVALFEADAENVALLDRLRLVVRGDFDHVIAALALGFQNFERLVGEVRGDDAVGDLVRKIGCGVRVAGVGQRRPVAVGAEAVRAAGADVGAGDGRKGLVRLNKVNLLVHLVERQAERRARGAEVQRAHEVVVERDVDDAGHGDEVHGVLAVTKAAEDRGDDVVRRDERNTDKADREIGVRALHGLLRCGHDCHNGTHK